MTDHRSPRERTQEIADKCGVTLWVQDADGHQVVCTPRRKEPRMKFRFVTTIQETIVGQPVLVWESVEPVGRVVTARDPDAEPTPVHLQVRAPRDMFFAGEGCFFTAEMSR